MATITLRNTKGTPLTNTELDANFSNLNTDKAELASPTFTGTVTAPNIQLNSNLLQFNNSGVRSWNTGVSGANLNTYSGDGLGAITFNNNIILHASNYNSYAPALTGTGASGTWGINVTGSAGSIGWSGITSKPTTLSGYGITDAALSSHTHSYLPLSGGTLTGALTWAAAAGTGNGNSRSLITGYSGGNYGQIGYGIDYTATSGVHNYAINDTVSMWEAHDGLRVYAAAGGTVGTAITWTTVLEARRSNSSMIFNGKTVLDSGNYSGYSPTLTGTGASGTWPINITGNATTLTNFLVSNSSNNGQEVTNNYIGYISDYSGTALTSGVGDGALYSQIYSSSWQHEIYGDYRSGQIALRGKNSGTWQAWRTVLDSGNYNSYSPTLTGTGASGNWAINVTGTAASISGFNNPTTAATANTTVYRDASANITGNYIFGTYFNSNAGNSENPTIGQIWTQSTGDNYLRKSTPAHLISQLSLLTTAGTAANSLLLNSKPSSAFHQRIHYGTTAQNTGYYKISILSTAGWMLSFTIRLYQGYQSQDIRVSGYQYGGNYWYSPTASLIDSTDASIDVRFGYDSVNNLWVAVPAGNYTGLDILDIVNGYTQIDGNYADQFSIANQTTLTGTVQSVITAYRPTKYNEVLRTDNYNSYSPTLTGTGASGTWGISISGNAATSTTSTTATNQSGGTVAATTGTFSGLLQASAGFQEKEIDLAANDIDIATGNIFSKTIAAPTTFTVSNVPVSGTVASFILDLTNGGAFGITWWANMKWASGTAPTLTTAGRDTLGFFTHNGGTTWTGLVLGKDIK